MLRRIERDQVRLGMFIHAFEGAWTRHPFWLPRFRLTEPADLASILDSDVPGVVIDEARGVPLSPGPTTPAASPGNGSGPPPPPPRRSSLAVEAARSFAEEREQAARLVSHSTREMKRLFASAHAGAGLELEAFTPLVTEVLASVSRNPFALVAITRLKKRDEYTYVHSLAVSALMTSFARTLGMGEAEVFELGLAGLLHDIGKMIVPERILRKPDSLTDEEFALVRTHPEQGYLLLSQNPATQPVILDVCRHHHERVDGSGYPLRLKGSEISRAARIAAICDVYDALTSDRAYKRAWTPQDAVARMAEWTGHFDRGLLVAFMKAVGVFPPGMLVRLRSNRLGVVLPNGRRASRPSVRAFYCCREKTALPIADVVVGDDLAHDAIVGEEYALDWGLLDWPGISAALLRGAAPEIGLAASQVSAS